MAGAKAHRTLGELLPATDEMAAVFPYRPGTGRYVGNRHSVDIDIFVTRYTRGYEVEWDGEHGEFQVAQFPTWPEVVAFYVTMRLLYGEQV